MYFSTPTTITILAAVPAILGSPLLESRQNGVTCQTSGGSPLTDDVTDVINQLNGQGGICGQTNQKASDCTTLVKHGSAAISICGGEDTTITCETVAGYADQIQQTCLNGAGSDPNTRTGGMYTINQSDRVEVINTSSV